MMLGVVASNGEKMLPVWIERGYRLTSAVYKEVLEIKVYHGAERKQIRSLTVESAGTHDKDCATLVGRQHGPVAQRFLSPTYIRLKPPRLQLVDAHWGKTLQDTHQQRRWAPGFCKPCMVVDEERLRQERLQELPTSIRSCYCRRRWLHWIIWFLLGANISLCYKSILITPQIILLLVFEVYKTKRNRIDSCGAR